MNTYNEFEWVCKAILDKFGNGVLSFPDSTHQIVLSSSASSGNIRWINPALPIAKHFESILTTGRPFEITFKTETNSHTITCVQDVFTDAADIEVESQFSPLAVVRAVDFEADVARPFLRPFFDPLEPDTLHLPANGVLPVKCFNVNVGETLYRCFTLPPASLGLERGEGRPSTVGLGFPSSADDTPESSSPSSSGQSVVEADQSGHSSQAVSSVLEDHLEESVIVPTKNGVSSSEETDELGVTSASGSFQDWAEAKSEVTGIGVPNIAQVTFMPASIFGNYGVRPLVQNGRSAIEFSHFLQLLPNGLDNDVQSVDRFYGALLDAIQTGNSNDFYPLDEVYIGWLGSCSKTLSETLNVPSELLFGSKSISCLLFTGLNMLVAQGRLSEIPGFMKAFSDSKSNVVNYEESYMGAFSVLKVESKREGSDHFILRVKDDAGDLWYMDPTDPYPRRDVKRKILAEGVV